MNCYLFPPFFARPRRALQSALKPLVASLLIVALGAGSIPPATAAAQPQGAPVVVTVDRSTRVGTSEMAVGVTHTQYSLDPWANADAVARGKTLLREGVAYQNQHIYGWGADQPQPGARRLQIGPRSTAACSSCATSAACPSSPSAARRTG